MATGGFYDSVKIWDVITGKQISGIDIQSQANTSRVDALAFCNNDTQLVIAYPVDFIGIWDVDSGEERRAIKSTKSRIPYSNAHRQADSTKLVLPLPRGMALANRSPCLTARWIFPSTRT